MLADNTNAAERDYVENEAETKDHSRAKRVGANVPERNRNRLLAKTIGGGLFALAIATIPRRRGRAAVQMAAGAALITVGLQQRRAGSKDGIDLAEPDERDGEENDVSAEAHAELDPDVVADDNPRDIADDSESEPTDGEENVEFTDDQMDEIDEPQSKPNLDAEGAEDPRLDDDDDETVDIDLSTASVAGDTGEAAGPTSQQSQPTSTKGTEPEPTATEDASNLQADKPAEDDSESDAETDDDSESDESETEEIELEDEGDETEEEEDRTF